MRTITLIPGDGIGPEVSQAVVNILKAAGAPVEFEIVEAGAHVIAEYGKPLPDYVIDSIKKNKVALKGPITTPIGKGFKSANVTLRQALDLYANLRPVKSIPGLKTKYENVDLVVVRENTEDLYAGIERMVDGDTAESIKRITRGASSKIAKFAFDYAVAQNREKVTAVHKANIMKMSDGLFLESVRAVGEDFTVAYEEQIVDALCMNLVMHPERFDVLVMPNLYGDIVSDLCAGFIGGLGLIPSGNIGDNMAVFEAVHGSAPDIAGLGLANPTALLQSAVMMLRYLGENDCSDRIEKALFRVYAEGEFLTKDVGGNSSTLKFTEEVISYL